MLSFKAEKMFLISVRLHDSCAGVKKDLVAMRSKVEILALFYFTQSNLAGNKSCCKQSNTKNVHQLENLHNEHPRNVKFFLFFWRFKRWNFYLAPSAPL